MDIFGLGPGEILLIILVALIFMGPKDIVRTSKSIGRFLRKLVLSEEWKTIQAAGKEIQHLPNRLMREASLDEIQQELKELDPRKEAEKLQRDYEKWQRDVSTWTTPPVEKKLPTVSDDKLDENKYSSDNDEESTT